MSRRSFVTHVLLIVFSVIQFSQDSWGQSSFFRKKGATGLSGTVIEAQDGSYRFTGMVHSDESPSYELFLMKLNRVGKVQWKKRFAAARVTLYNPTIVQSKDGNFILAASAQGGTLDSDILIIRIDKNGAVLSQKLIDSGLHEMVSAIANTADGGAVVTGTLYSGVQGEIFGTFVIQMDRHGKIQWSRMYRDTERGIGIAQTSDGGYVVANRFFDENDLSIQMNLKKLKSQGRTVWSKIISGRLNTITGSVAVSSKGDLVMAGTVADEGTDGFLIAFNSTGTLLWKKKYRFSDETGARTFNSSMSNVAATADGGLIAGGYASLSDGYQSFIMKLNAKGNIIWKKVFDAIHGDEDVVLQPTQDGGAVSTFKELTDDVASEEISVLKLDGSGNSPACVAEFPIQLKHSKIDLSIQNGTKNSATLPVSISNFSMKVSNWSNAFPNACS